MTSPHPLLAWFSPPEGFSGSFGWMAGYSADSDFLNDAVRRFGRRDGRISLALMLDRHQPQIAPVQTPGLLHLLVTDAERRKPGFRLQHAKIALLGFREEQGENYCLRLVVSTGNWQRCTIEESLDLAWSIDLYADELKPGGDDLRQRQADLAAAWDFTEWLRGRYDWRAIADSTEGRASSAHQELEGWVLRLGARKRGVTPRFFDNRKYSLLKQLSKLAQYNGAKFSNRLMLGSGFYEAPVGSGTPEVLQRIAQELRQDGLLTAKPGVQVYVNEEHCQAVACNLDSIWNEPGCWEVRIPSTPDAMKRGGKERTLHAKFIFGARKARSDYCLDAWVYLGSGNLTRHGFLLPITKGGNLEAGVVFAPQPMLEWEKDGEYSVSRFLPCDGKLQEVGSSTLKAEADEPWQLPEAVSAPPCAWLDWHPSGHGNGTHAPSGGRLQLSEPKPSALPELLGDDGQPCPYDDSNGYHWAGSQPLQVRVRWHSEGDGSLREAWVPVRYQGRFASAPLRTGLDLADMLAALLNAAGDEDDTEDEGGEFAPGGKGAGTGKQGASLAASTPGQSKRPFVRDAMILVERIAQWQTSLTLRDWPEWCQRLRSVLAERGFNGLMAQDIQRSGLNMLAPLRRPEFRPGFAEDGSSEAGRQYDLVLDEVERQWGIEAFPHLGDTN